MGLSGRLRSSLVIGGQGIRARKLRTFLSMISLFLGVLAVVVVQAAAGVAERAFIADTELRAGIDGTHTLYVPTDNPRAKAVLLDTLRGRSDAVAMTSGMSAIIGEPGVRPINEGGTSFDHLGESGPGQSISCDEHGCHPDSPVAESAPRGQAIALSVTAMTGDVRRFRPYRPDRGHWLDFTAAPALSPGIVLNRAAALGFSRYRVPAEMTFNGSPLHPTPRILGVVDDGQGAPQAYARLDELSRWLPPTDADHGAVEVMIDPAASAVQQTLQSRLAAAGVGRDQLQVRVVDEKKRSLDQLALIRWIFTALAALVLLIGVAGILNVGLATVGERIEEFALRRAVGTPRVLLAGIVLAETLLTGLLTASAAVGVAAAGLSIAEVLLAAREPALANIAFPWEAGVGGVVAGLAAGVLGGFIPAIRAARIPIATVMRA